jgi:prolyl-tRNA editing enzyme YbaK/EbsC (Cys-tRNA(Pro) deacylase)
MNPSGEITEGETEVTRRLRALLRAAEVPFVERVHVATRTSQESATARGDALDIGGKALVLKVDDDFRLFVLSAARRLDSGAIRRHFGASRARFATPPELLELTGLVPGSVPPFGEPLLPLPLYVDPSILANDLIAFNMGALTISTTLALSDYLALAKPQVFEYSMA